MPKSIPFSLQSLHAHSIFIPPPSTSTQPEDEWELLDQPSADVSPGQKNSRVLLREKDLIVAVDKEVRMTSLNASEGSWQIEDGLLGTYKTFESPHLTFPIHQLVLNPTGRLLAVIGHHQAVVLVLPKSTYSPAGGDGPVDVRSVPIDEFLFSSSSEEAIAKVQWHPWGENGNSLWILTANGKLREYDITQPHDALQTFDFLPERARSAKFTAVDPLSRYATSFAFGLNAVGFSPLMVHCLVANGDIYVLGPIIPLRTEMPTGYLQTLKAFTDSRFTRAQSAVKDVFGAGISDLVKLRSQMEWVDALVKQVRQREESENGKPLEEQPLGKETILAGSHDEASRKAEPRKPRQGTIRVHPPYLTASGGPATGVHRPLLRQGPVVFSPGAQDVGNGDEDLDEDQMATDLLIMEVGPEDEAESQKDAHKQTLFAIAWSGGRIDVGLELEKPEARWLSSRDTAAIQPVLNIVESILLTFPNNDPFIISSNAPLLTQDPLYHDVFYVTHAFGVDSINVRDVVDALNSEGDGELPLTHVTRLVESASVPNSPIVGVVHFCNITLGYGIIALASTGQVAYVELDLRFGDHAPLLAVTGKFGKTSKLELENQSLLAQALDFEKICSTVNDTSRYNPISALRKRVPESSKPCTLITSDHLSALGEISSQVHARVETIQSASHTVENRLDLQTRELQQHVSLLRQCRQDTDALQNGGTLKRAEELVRRQEEIRKRVEKIVGDMADRYKPEIGESERRWFKELEASEAQVKAGSGLEPGSTLTEKVELSQRQLATLLPLLSGSQRKEPSGTPQYSDRQLRPLQAALSVRSEEINRLTKRVEDLSTTVEATASI